MLTRLHIESSPSSKHNNYHRFEQLANIDKPFGSYYPKVNGYFIKEVLLKILTIILHKKSKIFPFGCSIF